MKDRMRASADVSLSIGTGRLAIGSTQAGVGGTGGLGDRAEPA